MTKYLDAENKLLDSVRRLAVGKGPIRERIVSAWVPITMLGKAGVDVPDSVKGETDKLYRAWGSVETPQIEHHAAGLSEEQCVQAAEDILRWLNLVRESR